MTKILHVLDHSLPEQDGYSYRSHSILSELTRTGVDVVAVTGPKHDPSGAGPDDVDGIRYRRTPLPQGTGLSGVAGQIRTVSSLRRRIAELLTEQSIDIVHAHSPCLNGLAALKLGKPLVYEMRSSWEDAAVSIGTTTYGSLRYRASRALETFVAAKADQVVVICEGLKSDLMDRGIDARKITVVPNALSAEMFVLPRPDETARIRARHGLADAQVVGFFGSYFEWEGVGLLIEAMSGLSARLPDAKLLLAGGGRQEAELRHLVRQRGLEQQVVFAGRVPHEEVPAYYGAVNVMAYPRVRSRLTEIVTPLKPLEAMAQNALVVASDVGGHREQVTDGHDGFLFPAGDKQALADTLLRALSLPPSAREEVIANAREKVERVHRWAAVCKRYLDVYDRLVVERARSVNEATR